MFYHRCIHHSITMVMLTCLRCDVRRALQRVMSGHQRRPLRDNNTARSPVLQKPVDESNAATGLNAEVL